jgi:hypothetical protein
VQGQHERFLGMVISGRAKMNTRLLAAMIGFLSGSFLSATSNMSGIGVIIMAISFFIAVVYWNDEDKIKNKDSSSGPAK